jgi:hypothetical protein
MYNGSEALDLDIGRRIFLQEGRLGEANKVSLFTRPDTVFEIGTVIKDPSHLDKVGVATRHLYWGVA